MKLHGSVSDQIPSVNSDTFSGTHGTSRFSSDEVASVSSVTISGTRGTSRFCE